MDAPSRKLFLSIAGAFLMLCAMPAEAQSVLTLSATPAEDQSLLTLSAAPPQAHSLLTLSATPPQAQSFNTLIYDITGSIDGADLLIIQGSTLQWHHPANSAAAVGRQAGSNKPTTISTFQNGTPLINAYNWIPDWPSPPPAEIRFDAYSSILAPLTPSLGGDIVSVSIEKISGRGTVTIEQSPNASNNFTLIARFADGGAGAALLDGRITVVTSVPEAGMPMLLTFGAALLWNARRRSPGRPIVACAVV